MSIAAATALLMTAAAVVVPAAASAAPWMRVSCQNPDGSPAPSEGWTGGAVGNVSLGSTNNTNCAPGTPMYAALAMPAPAADGSSEYLAYTPPAGSTLVGGSLLVGLQANGYGFRAAATAAMFTPAYVYDASNVFLQCVAILCGLPERPVGVLRRREPSPPTVAATCTSAPAATASYPSTSAAPAAAAASGPPSLSPGRTCCSQATLSRPARTSAAACSTPPRTAPRTSRSQPATRARASTRSRSRSARRRSTTRRRTRTRASACPSAPTAPAAR